MVNPLRSRRPGPHPPAAAEARTALEDLLTNSVLRWWYPGTLDVMEGGFRLNHDASGQYRGPSTKAIVTQARETWFFSRISRSPYGKPEHLEAARHGFEFLRDRMWDADHGGFHWHVDSTGTHVLRREKHMYGQAFGLYALSEYATVSGDPDAADLAGQLFNLIEAHAHDAAFGGYRELFEPDWSAATANTLNPVERSTPVGGKLRNTHIHVLEALTAYYVMSRDPLARERLIELITICSVAVVRPSAGAGNEFFTADWTPLPGFDRVTYGHDIETVWLLIDACRAAGIPTSPIRGQLEHVFATSRRYGFDERQGGFSESGRWGQRADRRSKVYWVQAEGMLAPLHLFWLTGDVKYLDCFHRTLRWIVERQVDRANGEFHAIISPRGRVTGAKADLWKAPYHQGRSLIMCLELLDQLSDPRGEE